MLRRSYIKKGQGISGEYVLLIALIAVVLVGMTTYVRRAIQARLRDASLLSVRNMSGALTNTTGVLTPVLIEYEPYYQQSDSNTQTSLISSESKLDNIISKDTDLQRQTVVNSMQLPF